MLWVIKLQENALYFDCFCFIEGRLYISKHKGNEYEQKTEVF